MLISLIDEGPLVEPKARQMFTVRTLRERGLVRPKSPNADGRDNPGLWFPTALAKRVVRTHRQRTLGEPRRP